MNVDHKLEVRYKTEDEWYCFTHAIPLALKSVKIETVVGEFPIFEDHQVEGDGDMYCLGDDDREDTRCIDCQHAEAFSMDWLETYAKKIK